MKDTNPIIQLLKNPIIIGLLALGITYGHLYYKENKRRKENPKSKKRKVDWSTPAIVGALCWFLSASYFDDGDIVIDELTQDNIEKIKEIHNKVSEDFAIMNNISKDNINKIKKIHQKLSEEYNVTRSDDSLSYHFVKKGDIVIPDLDVFLDVGEF